MSQATDRTSESFILSTHPRIIPYTLTINSLPNTTSIVHTLETATKAFSIPSIINLRAALTFGRLIETGGA